MKLVGEVRPPGFEKYNATSGSELAKFFLRLGPLGSSWSRARGTNLASTATVVVSVGEARPLEFVTFSGTSESESELAESSDEEETVPVWSRTSGTSSIAATAAVAKSSDEDRPPGFATYSATTESDFMLAGRVEEGVVKPGWEAIFVPSHTASNPYTGIHCGEASTSGPGLPRLHCWIEHRGSGQEQHASIWRCCGAHGVHSQRRRHRSENLLVNPGLLKSQSMVPRRNADSQFPLMKLGRRGPEQTARPTPKLQQS